jgi:threonine/homoserine/homoserine lactone efflux protein
MSEFWLPLIPYILLCLTVELTPGPNMAYLAILSISTGRRAGFFAVAGIAIGLALIGSLAAIGVANIIMRSPIWPSVLVGAGVVYLLWLAWCSWKEAPELSTDRATYADGEYFVRGLVTNLLNPKAFLFYVMVLPGFIRGHDDPIIYALLLTSISVIIATAVHVLIVLLGDVLRPYVNQPHRRRWVRRIMALMLVVIALWFAATNASLVFKKTS